MLLLLLYTFTRLFLRGMRRDPREFMKRSSQSLCQVERTAFKTISILKSPLRSDFKWQVGPTDVTSELISEKHDVCARQHQGCRYLAPTERFITATPDGTWIRFHLFLYRLISSIFYTCFHFVELFRSLLLLMAWSMSVWDGMLLTWVNMLHWNNKNRTYGIHHQENSSPDRYLIDRASPSRCSTVSSTRRCATPCATTGSAGGPGTACTN